MTVTIPVYIIPIIKDIIWFLIMIGVFYLQNAATKHKENRMTTPKDVFIFLLFGYFVRIVFACLLP